MATSSTSRSDSPSLPAQCRPHFGTAPWHFNELHFYCLCAPSHSAKDRFLRLPTFLLQAIEDRKFAISKKIRFTYCDDVEDISSGLEQVDLLIFPSMFHYKGITALDVESFVEEVVINGNAWPAEKSEKLAGVQYVFVCARSIGPDSNIPLSDIFKNEVAAQRLDQVVVRKCTHIYGDKYTGNVVLYTPDRGGDYAKYCWCDYVQEADIPFLVDEYLSKGKHIEDNWRLVKELNQKAQNGDDEYIAGTKSSFSSFASWVKANVSWASLAALGAMAALYAFSLSKMSKQNQVLQK